MWLVIKSWSSTGHLHGLGGAGGHLSALRALGQRAGARARPVHGVGGRHGGGARAGQTRHARGRHVAHALDEILERLSQFGRLSDVGLTTGIGHL